MSNAREQIILDFRGTGVVNGWQAIDDRIMGGCSLSRAEYVDQVGLRFAGTVSLENNGGFASIRSPFGHWDLGAYQGLRVRLHGDGKTYKLSLRTDRFFDGVSYQTSFTTDRACWQEIFLHFDTFLPTHHGIRLTTVAPLNRHHITSFGLFVADRQEGLFQLDVAWLKGA